MYAKPLEIIIIIIIDSKKKITQTKHNHTPHTHAHAYYIIICDKFDEQKNAPRSKTTESDASK